MSEANADGLASLKDMIARDGPELNETSRCSRGSCWMVWLLFVLIVSAAGLLLVAMGSDLRGRSSQVRVLGIEAAKLLSSHISKSRQSSDFMALATDAISKATPELEAAEDLRLWRCEKLYRQFDIVVEAILKLIPQVEHDLVKPIIDGFRQKIACQSITVHLNWNTLLVILLILLVVLGTGVTATFLDHGDQVVAHHKHM